MRDLPPGPTSFPDVDVDRHDPPLSFTPETTVALPSWGDPGGDSPLWERVVTGLTAEQRYELDGEIARGGMGVVWRGHDPVLGRDLALKVLLEQHKDNPALVGRFLTEAQICGQLQHPGIVPVYELGRCADGRPFFAMKLVKGRTLAQLLRERRNIGADRGRFIACFQSIAQTMAYAHARGVIHRDLKPANVMIGPVGEVQVMDWGLAKVLPPAPPPGADSDTDPDTNPSADSAIRTLRQDDPDGSDPSATRAGHVFGTPAYMAPEQALGQVHRVDARCDVFGLGAILCEVLTGHPPYRGRDTDELRRLAARSDLDDAISRLDASEADAELVALAKACLAVEPADRPANAGVVARGLQTYFESMEARIRRMEAEAAAAEVQAEAEARRLVEVQARMKRERQLRTTQLALAASLGAILILITAGLMWNHRQVQARVAARDAELARELETVQVFLGPVAQRAATGSIQVIVPGHEGAFHQKSMPLREVVKAVEAARRARVLVRELVDESGNVIESRKFRAR